MAGELNTFFSSTNKLHEGKNNVRILHYTDPNNGGADWNFTGYTFACDIRRTIGGALLTSATVTVTNAAGGEITWEITPAQTFLITAGQPAAADVTFVMDIEGTDGSGDISYWGSVTSGTMQREITTGS